MSLITVLSPVGELRTATTAIPRMPADLRGLTVGFLDNTKHNFDRLVEGIGLTKNGKTRILLANLTEKNQKVRLACPLLRGEIRVKRMDESNVMAAMGMPGVFRTDNGDVVSGSPLELELLPYSVLRVDGQ